MLDRLLETGARKRTSGWSGTVSVIVHSAIIALAIVGTATADPGPIVDRGPTMIPLEPPAPDAPREAIGGSHPGTSTTPVTPALPRIPVPGPVDIGTDIPTPSGPAGADTSALSEIGLPGGGTGSGLGTTGPASDNAVDTPVRVLDERVPLYPETLRSAGITGTVTMQFVIDTLGRVEPSSLRVLASTHELFTRAVLASLRQARFTPGEVAGRRVRTLVERSFRFDIGGAR